MLHQLKLWKVLLFYPLFLLFVTVRHFSDITKVMRNNLQCVTDKSNINNQVLHELNMSDSNINALISLNMCSRDRSHCQYECTNRTTLNDVTTRISTRDINVTRVELIPKLPFLTEYRSPCFVTNSDGQYTNGAARIRCLPYFFLAGFPKTGTTDLYQRMHIHGDINEPLIKEPHWWSNPKRPSFLSYTNYFYVNPDTNAQRSNNKTFIDTHLFGDFSTREILDESFSGSWTIETSTLYKLKSVLPCARFIVLLRDPVERLYSDYLYFSGRQYDSPNATDMTKITPRDFHKKCNQGIHWWKLCVLHHKGDVRSCLHGISTRGMPDLSRSHNKCWSNSNYTCKAFRNGLYYYYIRDWLEIFPKSHFKFIRLEDYSRNRIGIINDILRFLGARSFNNTEVQVVKRMARQVPGGAKLRNQYPPMMQETRLMLSQFYREANIRLSKLLGDESLLRLWQI